MRAAYTITALLLIVLGCAAPVERVYAEDSYERQNREYFRQKAEEEARAIRKFWEDDNKESQKRQEQERKDQLDREYGVGNGGAYSGGGGGYSDGDVTVKEFVGGVFTGLMVEAIRQRMEQLEQQKREESEKAAK